MPQYGSLKIDSFLYNDSGSDVTLDLIGIATKASPTFTGKINVTGWSQGNLTPGARYFLNGTGTVSATPPSSANQYVVQVGEALDANTIALNIDVPVLLK